MEIKRDAYLRKLTRRMNNGLIKIVTGIRRCGKSYLLFNIFHQYLRGRGVAEDHIIEIGLDDYAYRDLRDPSAMYAYVKDRLKDDGMYYVILDEVQLLRDFVDVLNGFLHMRNVDVYVTGSNSKFLSSDVATEFRGRGDEIHMLPLSFSEYVTAYDGSMGEAWDDYVNYGGLPLILSKEEPAEKEAYLASLFQELYLTDLKERHDIRHPEEFDELLDILASSIGSMTNPLKLSRTFKSLKNKDIGDVTISRYIGYMEEAFLLSRAVRYDIKGKKYIGSPAKYYFEDMGLRNARLQFRQTEENHIMENILYNELRYRDFLVDVGVVKAFDKNSKGKTERKNYEVDFVATKGNLKIYVQSAFSMANPQKAAQETRPLRQIPDSFQKIIVISDDRKPRRDENGFVVVGVRQFLLDEEITRG